MSGVTAKRREWLFLLAAALVVCTGILPSASAVTGRAYDTTAISVDTSDFAVAISVGGRHLTTLGGPVAPFTYWTTSNVEHRATRVLSKKQAGPTTTYTVATSEQGRNMSVSIRQLTTGVQITYAVDAPATITAVGIAMTASPTAHYLGSGQRVSSVDMRRTVQPLKASSDCQSSSPSPFFVSTSGLGAWASTWAVGRMAFPGATDDPNACSLEAPVCPVGPPANAVRFCFKTATATMTVARGSLEQLVIAHAKATGLPRAPWLPQLALIKWRDRIAAPAALFDDIKQLRARHIPIGWVLLDNPWEQGASHSACYGSLTFDTTAYPDPKAMIARIHAEGVRFMLWISPQINRTPPCPAPNYPDGWLSGDDQTFVWDLTLPAARDSYISHLKALVDLGVDGFKGDRGDEVNLEPDRLAGGPGTVFQNLYPLLYDRATEAGLEARHGKNFATMSRSVVPGSSSVLPGFVGPDAEQSYNGLEAEIRAGQTAGIAGAPVWGSDVGGYAGGGPLTAGVFVRWAQFEALAP
ncbi:MAG: alpha-D-xyloside xylohydrolase, partial [Pseudonocardiales bacterium]|nr:alpha-D-xyloside xylohydrolase [Pseudonocardiales bacterium]